MIHLDRVPVREEQAAARTYSSLSLEENCHPRGRQPVIAEPLRPIPQVTVIVTGHDAHFRMAADGRVGVMHEAQSIWGHKLQPACRTPTPIFIEDRPDASVSVASARPMFRCGHEVVVARGKRAAW
jgi:hypothetical protein